MKITESMIKRACCAAVYRRGEEYFKEGRVHLKKRGEETVTAVVDDEKLYDVMVKIKDGKVEDKICGCPYFETMGSACKHIAATLMQLRREIEDTSGFSDTGDAAAHALCGRFAEKNAEKTVLNARFTLYITHIAKNITFKMSICIGDSEGAVCGIENFLENYSRKRKAVLTKNISYSPYQTEFPHPQSQILDILAEAYENRDNFGISKATYQMAFGASTAKRIFALLKQVDFTLVLDGMRIPGIRILDDDPDIVMDVDSLDGEVCLSVSDRGSMLIPDGSYFLHENTIYHTSEEWREYFVPIYNALCENNRMQLVFRGANKTLFVRYVLPALKGKHGVVTQGIDEVIISEKPIFDIYFDAPDKSIRAVVAVRYGSVTFKFPKVDVEPQSIVIRDEEAENNILSAFEKFSVEDGAFVLRDDNEIYEFLRYSLPLLSRGARLFTTDVFERFHTDRRVNVSASVRYNTKLDLLETNFKTDISPEEMRGILASIRLKKSFYRMNDGTFFNLENTEEREIFDVMDRLGFSPDEAERGEKLVPKYNLLYLDEVNSIKKDESFAEYMDKIRAMEPNIPEELKDVLRPYQTNGTAWLERLAAMGFGGILADDMGLGKTLQVIAFVHGEKPQLPTLIVVPSALTYNWKNEISRFVPDATVIIMDGSREQRRKMSDTVDNYEFVIVSYPILRRDIDVFEKKKFAYCFIDEAQYIKNPATMNARSVKRINAGRRFAITGTPIENSLTELWSIFDFIMSGYLKSLSDFRREYETPIVKEGSKSALEMLKMRIKPFVLRRIKKDVLEELPAKLEYTVYAEMTPKQKNMYMSFLTLARGRTLSLLGSGGRNRMQILTLLMRLRQICCHPLLFDEGYSGNSGKLDLLMELVTSAEEAGHRILIFSQYTSMLELIRAELDKRKLRSFYIDGKTPSYERTERADRFNAGERNVFLISLRAGGTGLNLTGADTVIHYDPWWNPAAMDQASDRAYRIGQTRDVQVIRLVAKDTIEEKIMKMQDAKRSLADDIIKVSNDAFARLSNDEIISLFE